MTEKKAATGKKYQLRGEYKRRENGKDVQPGEVVTLAHLTDKKIAALLKFGIYKEVK